ncbi:MAG: HAD family phosphatase [Paludibacteraceae bacterium]|nr:HAD family phosphatase [Paludibacteraceae bacterium]
MIHSLLFDLGGVLIDLDVQRSLNAIGALTDRNKRNNYITSDGLLGGHDSHLINLYQTGDISTDDFLQTILRSCRQGVTKEQVIEAWFAMLLGMQERKIQLLHELKQKGYNIYILSNINELHVDWTMQHCPVLRQMDGLFFSNEIHLAKPDPRCYDYVLQHTDILPQETLYIDDLLPNINAGKQAGLQTWHVQNDEWVDEMRRTLL